MEPHPVEQRSDIETTIVLGAPPRDLDLNGVGMEAEVAEVVGAASAGHAADPPSGLAFEG